MVCVFVQREHLCNSSNARWVFVFDYVMHEKALYRWIDNGIMNYYYFICDAYTLWCASHGIRTTHTLVHHCSAIILSSTCSNNIMASTERHQRHCNEKKDEGINKWHEPIQHVYTLNAPWSIVYHMHRGTKVCIPSFLVYHSLYRYGETGSVNKSIKTTTYP